MKRLHTSSIALLTAAMFSIPAAARSPKLDCRITAYHPTLVPAEKLCTADRDHDGTADYAVKKIFSPERLLVRQETDRNYDGSIDTISIWRYDAHRRKIYMEMDRKGDGSPDLVCTWEYNASGKKSLQECDRGGDGSIDQILAWEYDAAGKVSRKTRRDGLGVLEKVWMPGFGWRAAKYAKRD